MWKERRELSSSPPSVLVLGGAGPCWSGLECHGLESFRQELGVPELCSHQFFTTQSLPFHKPRMKPIS